MFRRNILFTATLLGALALPASLSFAQATDNGGGQGRSAPNDRGNQDNGGRNRGGRGNFDPAQFRQRMEERLKEQLGTNDDEWKVIQPKLQKVMEAQRDARGGGFFGGRGRGGDRGPGGNSSQAQSPVQQAQRDLRQTLDNKDASADEIKAKLTALRDAREKAKAELAAAQKDLRDVLTQRQEATLVMLGMLDNGQPRAR
jgi:hypothetical protein